MKHAATVQPAKSATGHASNPPAVLKAPEKTFVLGSSGQASRDEVGSDRGKAGSEHPAQNPTRMADRCKTNGWRNWLAGPRHGANTKNFGPKSLLHPCQSSVQSRRIDRGAASTLGRHQRHLPAGRSLAGFGRRPWPDGTVKARWLRFQIAPDRPRPSKTALISLMGHQAHGGDKSALCARWSIASETLKVTKS